MTHTVWAQQNWPQGHTYEQPDCVIARRERLYWSVRAFCHRFNSIHWWRKLPLWWRSQNFESLFMRWRNVQPPVQPMWLSLAWQVCKTQATRKSLMHVIDIMRHGRPTLISKIAQTRHQASQGQVYYCIKQNVIWPDVSYVTSWSSKTLYPSIVGYARRHEVGSYRSQIVRNDSQDEA